MGDQNEFDIIAERVKDVPGDFIEIGVYKGDSARAIQRALPEGKRFFLVDTFSGHPCFNERYDDLEHPIGRYNDANWEQICADFPAACILRTDIRTLGDLQIKIAFAHIDVDQYESTLAAIKFVVPRLSKGGVIRFDDYNAVSGATQAIDELIGRKNITNEHLFRL